MGRRPTFDRDAVLDRALALFWRRGYGATSMREVADATALGAGSLYAAFGDKRGLFEAVLERYGATVSARTFAPLGDPDAGFPAIEAVFARLAEPDVDDAAPGCLITNTACEAALGDESLRAGLRVDLARLEQRLSRILERALQAGELADDVAPEDAAAFLVGLAQGMRVLARLGEPHERLHLVARTGLAGLRARPTTSAQLERNLP